MLLTMHEPMGKSYTLLQNCPDSKRIDLFSYKQSDSFCKGDLIIAADRIFVRVIGQYIEFDIRTLLVKRVEWTERMVKLDVKAEDGAEYIQYEKPGEQQDLQKITKHGDPETMRRNFDKL